MQIKYIDDCSPSATTGVIIFQILLAKYLLAMTVHIACQIHS